MSKDDPTQQELADFAELWARRVAQECPFPGARVALIVRHPKEHAGGRDSPVARGMSVATELDGLRGSAYSALVGRELMERELAAAACAQAHPGERCPGFHALGPRGYVPLEIRHEGAIKLEDAELEDLAAEPGALEACDPVELSFCVYCGERVVLTPDHVLACMKKPRTLQDSIKIAERLGEELERLGGPQKLQAAIARPGPADHIEDIRVERSWHGGHTLVVFQTLGPRQIAISVIGSKKTETPPRDPKTGRNVEYSIGLVEEDIVALEDFLRERRLHVGRSA